jgi:hypothetical protein
MGFLSGIFGSKSDWDGSRYVEKIAGTKFWHEHFIDKDEMKRYGQILALDLDPFGPRTREQSPATIVGELIFLLQVCEMHNDKKAASYVARAIKDLLENHENILPKFSSMKFISEGYLSHLKNA